MREQVGHLVCARSAVWRVLGVEEGEADCRAVRLLRVHPPPLGAQATLLAPFDVIRALEAGHRPRVVRPRTAISACCSAIAAGRRWADPWPAVVSDAELLPWQLVPAILLRTGTARAVLLADAVGLGKTVQAGLVAADLLTRRARGRILVLTPAGLRDQWRNELARRFALGAAIVDLAWLEQHALCLPAHVNPWTIPTVAIASFDFAKRSEVLPGPDSIRWDLVIVDEAHAASARTERASLVTGVCRHAAHVLLLTATPHDGDDARFRALCRLCARDGDLPIAIVRRTRDVVGVRQRRRLRTLRVGLSPAERRLAALLEEYARRVHRERGAGSAADARLAMQVLLKRAASSAWALETTARRRRALLSSASCSEPLQPTLPFALTDGDEVDAPDAVLRAPGLWNARREVAWLGVLVEAARNAAGRQRKLAALQRLLGRTREPALIFTEYRDTLARLAKTLAASGPVEVLHGLQGHAERASALRAFTGGGARLLIATDAASEGLNLHQRCRLVILFDLPWTPTRLDQRIGRVDRLGQSRRVHAVALVARDAFQERLLASLQSRTTRIGDALSRATAGCAEQRWESRAADAARRLLNQRRALAALARVGKWDGEPPLQDAFAARLSRLEAGLARRRPWVALSRRRRGRAGWSGAIAIIELLLVQRSGTVVHRSIVGVHVPCPVPPLTTCAEVRQFAADRILPFGDVLVQAARDAAAPALRQDDHDWHRYHRVLRDEQRSKRGAAASGEAPLQPGLFGHYAPGPRSTCASACPPLNDAPNDDSAPRSRLEMIAILLRAGPGRAPHGDRNGTEQLA